MALNLLFYLVLGWVNRFVMGVSWPLGRYVEKDGYSMIVGKGYSLVKGDHW